VINKCEKTKPSAKHLSIYNKQQKTYTSGASSKV